MLYVWQKNKDMYIKLVKAAQLIRSWQIQLFLWDNNKEDLVIAS